MRRALWPDHTEGEHEPEMVAWLAPPDAAVIVGVRDSGALCGFAEGLVEAVETWARGHGLHELTSDALLENAEGQRAHEHVGFVEVERAVRYRKPVRSDRVLSAKA
jgi:hypothetical protein